MIEWAPTAREVVVIVAVATPLTLVSWAVPSTVEPSLKVTVPVGVPVAGATTATVAVSVTDWPKTGEAVLAATVVLVAARLRGIGE